MGKTMYLKHSIKELAYNKAIDNFKDHFKLKKIKQNNKVYFFENDEMIVKFKPDMVEFLLYDNYNKKTISKIRNYFFR